ncbi:MAG: Trm112 family protein [Bdellovibrionales bacterium]
MPHEHKASPKMLEMLCCPVTHAPLQYNAQKKELFSEKAGLAFPVQEGIPIMLTDEARELLD